MKKSIAVLLALILMMTAVFFGCGKKEEAEEANGEETSAQVNTDETTTESGDIIITPNTGANDTTAAVLPSDTPDVTEPSEEPSSEPSTTPSQPTVTLTPSQPDNGTAQPSTSYLAGSKLEKYNDIFKTGTYRMTVTTEIDGTEDMSFDLACKNGNVRMGTSMEGIPAIMIYRADTGTAYMLFEMLGKFYTELTEELMGEEIDFSEATEGFAVPENGTLTTGTDTLDGRTVSTESVTGDGKTVVFCFDNSGTLVATKTIEDGVESITKISNLTTTVDDSLFEIPKGYIYMDLSSLMGM